MTFEWVPFSEVDDSLLHEFKSGVEQYDGFLHNDARQWALKSESVTYVCVDGEEVKDKSYKRVYGFAALNTTGLLYHEGDKKRQLTCAEIRLFAISHVMRKRHDQTITWSDDMFKSLLQMLYVMSTKTIGFKGIFLNSNEFGYSLYKRNGFTEISDYIVPDEDDKLEIENCTPLLLLINDEMLYDIYS